MELYRIRDLAVECAEDFIAEHEATDDDFADAGSFISGYGHYWRFPTHEEFVNARSQYGRTWWQRNVMERPWRSAEVDAFDAPRFLVSLAECIR